MRNLHDWIVLTLTLISLVGCSPFSRLEGTKEAFDATTLLPIRDILAEHAPLFRQEKGMALRINRLAEERPYRTPVEVTGVARPVKPMHWDLIQIWSRYNSIPVDFSRQFTREIEVRQGEDTYWLASRPAEQHPDSSGRGEARLMLVGAVNGPEGWEPVFLLNRFSPEPTK